MATHEKLLIALALVSAATGLILFLVMRWCHRTARHRAFAVVSAHWREKVTAGGILLVGMTLAAGAFRSATESHGPQGNGTESVATRTESTRPQRSAPVRNADGTLPAAPVRYVGQRQREFAERWAHVCCEVGPPPTPEAVPVVGYMAGAVHFPSRWRMPPDADAGNNFKRVASKGE